MADDTLADKIAKEAANGKVDFVRTPVVSSIPTPGQDLASMKKTLIAVKQLLDAKIGRGGSPYDQWVSMRDLVDAGTINVSIGGKTLGTASYPSTGGSGSTGGGTADPRPFLSTPPTPTNLTAQGSYKHVILSWDLTAYRNHSYVEVWRNTVNTLGTAVAIAQAAANVYADDTAAPSTTYYYWVRAVGYDTSASAIYGAFNAVGGVSGGLGLIGNVDLGPLIVQAANLAFGAVSDITKFASGIEPVGILGSVPGSLGGNPKTILVSGTLYRWNGSSYTAAVPTSDLSGTITSTQIDNNAITTPKLAANAVTAAKIAAGTITSNEIAANTIIAGNIAAGTVTATEIAVGAITATKLAANAIAVGSLAVQNGAISNAMIENLAVDNAKIANATITSGKINVTQLSAIAADLGSITAGSITSVTISAATITGTTITGGLFQTATSGKRIMINESSLNTVRLYDNAGAGNQLVVEIGAGSGFGNYLASFGTLSGGNNTNALGGFSNSGQGLFGQSVSNAGVYGQSSSNVGVNGVSSSYVGVYGTTSSNTSGAGVVGLNNSTGYGVFGQSSGANGVGVRAYGAAASGVGLYATGGAKAIDADGGVAVTGLGAGSDPYGMVAVTMPTTSSYAYFSMTRASSQTYSLGIDTSNQFWIGVGTAGHVSTAAIKRLVIGSAGVAITNGFGCNGAGPQSPYALPGPGADPVANACRQALINCGICA